jgi:hypothetical protein
MSADLNVLDALQLRRIEAVHRGYLYQHLYAVACFFNAAKAGVRSIAVESDEDVELERSNKRDYLQIKTRAEVLTKGDIQGALDRFARLRAEHVSGKRKSVAAFAIVSNVSPGASLLTELGGGEWPNDIAIYWPDNPPNDMALPRPWPDLAHAIDGCVASAASLPLGALLPETLVLKLSGLVQAASAGVSPRGDHKFRGDEMPSLFEQMALQLQDFPAPPARYRPLQNEPSLISDRRLRAIVGLSGAGKTAWVAEAAMLNAADMAYFDVGDTPSTAIAIPIARELAGRFFGNGGGLGSIILPGATGFDMLRALDNRFTSEGRQTLVVIDNAHRVAADDLLAVTDLVPGVSFILLCQPGSLVDGLRSLRGIIPETLSGWGSDTIAAEAADAKCIITANSIERVCELTGGLPLFVQNACRIAVEEYKGVLADFCRAIADLTHNVITAQELILSKVFKTISRSAQDVLAVLSLSDIALTKEDATAVCATALGTSDKVFASSVRELRSVGAVEIFGIDSIKVHDAFRVLGRAHLSESKATDADKALLALREVVFKSLVANRSPQKFSLYIRLLGEMGDIRSLTQFATDELFHEIGAFYEIADVLEKASTNTALPPDQRFSALDGLIFNDLRTGRIEDAGKRLAIMEMIATEHKLDATDMANFGNKVMMYASQVGDIKVVEEQSEKLRRFFPGDAMRDRILRYNIAHANFKIGRQEKCISEVETLIKEYYSEIGITPAQVFMQNPDKIWKLLDKKKDHTDSLKHLADSLDLLAQASNKIGLECVNARITAIKFYAMVNALESVVRVGQDLVDEFVRRHDYIGARQILESTLIPNVMALKMTEYVLPVRRHYAVVLAYCGDHDAADAEMAKLAPYEKGLDATNRKEYQAQLDLLARLRRRAPPAQVKIQVPDWASDRARDAAPMPKVGRNEQCPCGSGIKYKKCCGKN